MIDYFSLILFIHYKTNEVYPTNVRIIIVKESFNLKRELTINIEINKD